MIGIILLIFNKFRLYKSKGNKFFQILEWLGIYCILIEIIVPLYIDILKYCITILDLTKFNMTNNITYKLIELLHLNPEYIYIYLYYRYYQ